jgi:benzodiazapine receptor
MRWNWVVIPLITIIVALSGSFLTSTGMMGEPSWYDSINKPDFTPPGSFIGTVWTILFILATISALIFWNLHRPFGNVPRDGRFRFITFMFLLNAALNVFWSFLFFNQHLIFAAFVEAIVLGLTVVILVVAIWPLSKWSSVLLIPYALWVGFASYLTYAVWQANSVPYVIE